ncbi:unnamed protein product [Adineta ricciae]|uniref:Uncharacterized protein n=1 Tax=Adineta ricciae TaxID=249248 RepID=A0A815S7I3_ADIRI|nr:unnamed protein product [Adineta ricciae]CAF1488699.1 unnamed protein product [Adineta ricciae]
MASNPLTNIDHLVSDTFENAVKTGDVVLELGKTIEHSVDGCPYHLRSVLSHKQKPLKGDVGKTDKDPFAPPYDKCVHVCDIPNYGSNKTTYAVVLNKFPSTKNQFLVAPHEFANQSDPLSADELSLCYQIIRNYRTTKLLVFFNCGEDSGASQKHKHIQFFPVLPNDPPIDVFLQEEQNYSQACQISQVPWAHFVISIRPPEQIDHLAEYLMNQFIQLLDEMFSFKEGKEFNPLKTSYNVVMTKNYLHIIPRTKDTFILKNGSKVPIGGIDYAGIIIVKDDEDIDEVINYGITNMLLEVGRKKDEENKA